jgi:hypothetical protein
LHANGLKTAGLPPVPEVRKKRKNLGIFIVGPGRDYKLSLPFFGLIQDKELKRSGAQEITFWHFSLFP